MMVYVQNTALNTAFQQLLSTGVRTSCFALLVN